MNRRTLIAGLVATDRFDISAAQLAGALIGWALHHALGVPRSGHPNIVESSGEPGPVESN